MRDINREPQINQNIYQFFPGLPILPVLVAANTEYTSAGDRATKSVAGHQ